MNAIHEFVLKGGQKVTVGAMNAFRPKLPLSKAKAETIEAPEFPHLREQVHFLASYAEDVLDGAYPCNDLPAAAEAVFALGYLLSDVDIIPDSVPGKGYADDSAVLRAVLVSHEPEFRAYAASVGKNFDKFGTSA
jgi:uncharacterized membrane protein YkvA (DUF1232 family)